MLLLLPAAAMVDLVVVGAGVVCKKNNVLIRNKMITRLRVFLPRTSLRREFRGGWDRGALEPSPEGDADIVLCSGV